MIAGGLTIFLLTILSLMVPWTPAAFSPVGLTSPALLALLLLTRRRQWPWAAAGAFAGAAAAGLIMRETPALAPVLAFTSVAEAYACASLLVWRMGRSLEMTELADLGRYTLITAASCLLGGVVAGYAEQVLTGVSPWPNMMIWAARDFAGMATLTLGLLVLARRRGDWRLRSWLDAWPFAFLLVAEAIVFFQDSTPLTYLVLASLALVTWRTQIVGAAVGMLTILVTATGATLLGRGPFADMPATITAQLLAVQLFAGACFYLSVPVAAQMRRSHRLQKQLGEALVSARDSEARYRVIADSTRDIVLHLDLEWRILYVSPSCEVLGYRPEEMIGRPGSDFVHPDEIKRLRDNAAHFLSGAHEAALDRRHRLRLKDGSYRWYEGNPSPVLDEAGAILGIVNIIRDVHETTLAAKALADSEARYRLLADNVSDIVVRFDINSRVAYTSPSVRALGYTPEEVVGRRVEDFVHPEDIPRLRANIADILSGVEARADHSFRLRTKDGAYRLYDGSPSQATDEVGRVVGLITILRDVAEQVAASEALAASEARYRLLADNMGDMVACYGRDGILTFVSGATKATLGYEAAELVGRDINAMIHPDDAKASAPLFERHIAEGPGASAFRFAYRLARKDGSFAWLEAQPRAHYDAEGGFIEWQDMIRDIGEHKALEEQLRGARRDADAATKTKAEFLADMSHELRGPLTSIVGFARLARGQPGVHASARTHLERIEDASLDLIGMVNDVLDFSRLEAAEVVFRPRPVAVSEPARAALSFMEAQARAKDLEFVLIDRTVAGAMVSIDDGRVRQVLLNLLGNAVKFTHAGRVTLQVDHDPETQRLSVEVRDTGPGIPADRLGRLFDRFTQVSAEGGVRAYAGAGLGLAISKGIVEALGGGISAESKLGRGSCFSFWIPAPPATELADEADETTPRLRLMVVDGDLDIRELVARALAPHRIVVLSAADGEAAEKLAARELVDIVVADLELARANGYGALLRVRRRRGRKAAVPVLVLSHTADSALYAQVVDEGFHGLVAKPFTPSELVSAIAHALAIAREAA